MLNIDRNNIDIITKQRDSKNQIGREKHELRKTYRSSLFNMIDELDDLSAYELGHFINFIDRWLHNRNSDNTTTYKRGDIVFIDLGANNFRFEPSYTHPAIILKNSYNSILIVPCSTKKYGRNLSDVIDATASDGFTRNTGIQLGALRWINKNRIISNTGKRVSGRILDKINEKILSYVPTYKRDKRIYEATKRENEDLKRENEDLKLKLEKLNKE